MGKDYHHRKELFVVCDKSVKEVCLRLTMAIAQLLRCRENKWMFSIVKKMEIAGCFYRMAGG